jgi:RNA polymerase sigma factor (sigma-70 family)
MKRFKRTNVAGVSGSYLEHKSVLKRYLSRFLTSPDDIDDVLQETFLRAFQAEGKDARIRSPKAYLTRIARNIALKELHKRSTLVFGYVDEVATPETYGSTPTEQHVVEHERIAVFCKAAASLPAQCRKAFLMCKVYGFSHQEIAQELGISVSTVEKHLASGLQRCNEYMTARGFVPVRKKRVA